MEVARNYLSIALAESAAFDVWFVYFSVNEAVELIIFRFRLRGGFIISFTIMNWLLWDEISLKLTEL